MGALAGLLPLLAVLQYHWIGQLTDADKERRQAHLRNSTNNLRNEINAEITRPFQAFLMIRPGGEGIEPADYAERYQAWAAATPYKQMVRDLYLLDRVEEEEPRLSRFNPASGEFAPVAWPPQFTGLRARLAPDAPREPRAPGGGLSSVVDDGKTLLLMAPRMRFPERPRMGDRPPQRPQGPPRSPGERLGWVIAELDRDYVRNELLSHFIARNIPPDFLVRVYSKADPGQILHGEEAAFAQMDESVSLLDLRVDQLWQAAARERPQRDSGPRRQGGFAGFRGPGPPAGLAGSPRDRGAWHIEVAHRAGSLEAAVGRTRLRNLGVSGIIMLVMGASVVMLIVTTRRSQKLARQQMEFVAGISHELRTPLSVICSAGENLADGLVKNEGQIKKYGKLVRDEGRRLSEMVDQILGLAGIGSRQLRLTVKPVEVEIIIDRALEASAQALREYGCEVETEIEPNLPPALADPASLSHCVGNLVSNAAKYGPAEGRVKVTAARGAKGSSGELCISVADEGPGIDPADLPHIFEPFYRGRNAIDDQVHGVGLGLSLVQKIVEAHSGKVEVTSAPGRGSCFTLHIPAATVAQA
jgi:signal transduction histidine kinase